MELIDSEYALLQDSANKASADDLKCNRGQRSPNAAVVPSTNTTTFNDDEQLYHQAMSIRNVLRQWYPSQSMNPAF